MEFLEKKRRKRKNEINNQMPLNMFNSNSLARDRLNGLCSLVSGERIEILGHFYGFSFDSMKNRARRDSDARLERHRAHRQLI